MGQLRRGHQDHVCSTSSAHLYVYRRHTIVFANPDVRGASGAATAAADLCIEAERSPSRSDHSVLAV
jgi:hypothetical protein